MEGQISNICTTEMGIMEHVQQKQPHQYRKVLLNLANKELVPIMIYCDDRFFPPKHINFPSYIACAVYLQSKS